MYPPEYFAIRLDGKRLIAMPGDVWHVQNEEEEEFGIVMQSTGLQDKNGKEIFEGDILLYEGKELEVKWKDSGFWVMQMVSMFEGAVDDWLHEMDTTKAKNIGNVYEHPHLLP